MFLHIVFCGNKSFFLIIPDPVSSPKPPYMPPNKKQICNRLINISGQKSIQFNNKKHFKTGY